MNNTTTQTNLQDPRAILNQCVLLNHTDHIHESHELIVRFGSPETALYFDETDVTIDGVEYSYPLILPIYNAKMELIQCAVMQDQKIVKTIPERLPKGFAYFGELQHDKPIILVYDLETFFKLAQSKYAVCLVILDSLCTQSKPSLRKSDFERVSFIATQLSKAGFKKVYLPCQAEQVKDAQFQQLSKDTGLYLLNESIKVGNDVTFLDIHKEDDIIGVEVLMDEAIKQSINLVLPEWGELIPLSNVSDEINNPYPLHALPTLAREAAQAIAEHVQAPIAMTAQCVIGAMSHIAQAKVNAPHPFNAHGEPCSLFLLTEGQSGSRKSTSRNLADRAIIQHERNQYDQYRKQLEQWKTAQAGLPKKDREAYAAENPPPNDPSTLYSDITLESIAGLYIDGILNNASIASDEAGQFFGGHTMKADTKNQAIGGYAKLFDDGFIERSRSKANMNGSGRAYDVRLTFNLQGQREVLSESIKDPVLRGQGFLPRFILANPENLAGTRLQDAIYKSKNANLDHRLIAYWTRCAYLLDDCPHVKNEHELNNGRFVMPMNDEARRIDLEFYNLFESLQGKGKQYEYLQAFASRASQLARRLATIFAYFEGLQWIDAKTLRGACEIISHSLTEWASYADIETKSESDAERLIKWITQKCQDKKTDRLTYSYIQTSCPRPMQKNKNLLEMVVSQLIDFNHIKIEVIGKTRFVLINPILSK